MLVVALAALSAVEADIYVLLAQPWSLNKSEVFW